ncbi:MAG: sporulation protein YabP [Lachnospiraceae bacterium]|nr:sporulation protein YabP [Lachnospiraceae bacterium]
MADEKRRDIRHTVVMENREYVNVTGVSDVISFDEENIICETDMGTLIIKGEDLHVVKINLEDGDLMIEGNVIGLNYEESGSFGPKSSFLSKIFK